MALKLATDEVAPPAPTDAEAPPALAGRRSPPAAAAARAAAQVMATCGDAGGAVKMGLRTIWGVPSKAGRAGAQRSFGGGSILVVVRLLIVRIRKSRKRNVLNSSAINGSFLCCNSDDSGIFVAEVIIPRAWVSPRSLYPSSSLGSRRAARFL
jgi:hypothetical protein